MPLQHSHQHSSCIIWSCFRDIMVNVNLWRNWSSRIKAFRWSSSAEHICDAVCVLVWQLYAHTLPKLLWIPGFSRRYVFKVVCVFAWQVICEVTLFVQLQMCTLEPWREYKCITLVMFDLCLPGFCSHIVSEYPKDCRQWHGLDYEKTSMVGVHSFKFMVTTTAWCVTVVTSFAWMILKYWTDYLSMLECLFNTWHT